MAVARMVTLMTEGAVMQKDGDLTDERSTKSGFQERSSSLTIRQIESKRPSSSQWRRRLS